MACGHQFRAGLTWSSKQIWDLFLDGKQTIAQISAESGLSASTIKRRLRTIEIAWKQPPIDGSGVVHLDATYFGRNTGVLLAIEAGSGRLLYMKHIKHEHIGDYADAVASIAERGYCVSGVVIDGLQKLFTVLSDCPIQMCQFHMVAIIRRKLTRNPQLAAGRELLELAFAMKTLSSQSFKDRFKEWKKKWHDFLAEKTFNQETGRAIYTHQRLRSAMTSISFYLPYLFTYEAVEGMPNTNNPIEGVFTDLKKKLRVHPGMTAEHRERFMNGFFLAYTKLHNQNGDGR